MIENLKRHNLPPQKRSQTRVKRREDKVHQEEAIQFLSYKALPALKTAEIKKHLQKCQKPSESAKAALTDYHMPRDRNCNKFKADLCKPVNRDFLVPRQFS